MSKNKIECPRCTEYIMVDLDDEDDFIFCEYCNKRFFIDDICHE